jgi:hypothetical protein
MGCEIKSNNNPETIELIFQNSNKGYSKEVLEKISDLIPVVQTWLQDNIGDISNDLIVLRGGVPTMQAALDGNTLTASSDTLTKEVYTNEFGDDSLVMSSFINVDYIKITSRVVDESKNQLTTSYDMYHYESPYVHRTYGNYFKLGVYNATKPQIKSGTTFSKTVNQLVNTVGYLQYVDNLNLSGVKSPIGLIPVQYDGTLGTTTGVFTAVPDDFLRLVTFISQNLYLLGSMSPVDKEEDLKERVLIGDKYVNTVAGFITALDRVKATCNDRLSRFADEYLGTDMYRDINELLVGAGLEDAFKDLRYGGDIDELLLTIRIPASPVNVQGMYDLLESGEVVDAWNADHPAELITLSTVSQEHEDWYFNKVFKVEYFTAPDENVFDDEQIEENSVKKPHLWDKQIVIDTLDKRVGGKLSDPDDLEVINLWYNTNYITSDVINEVAPDLYDDGKGCLSYFTSEESSSVAIKRYKHYRVDHDWLRASSPVVKANIFYAGLDLQTSADNRCKFDQVIMIVIIIVMAIYGVPPEASAWVLAAYWTAVVIQIALVAGVWEGKTAQRMQILATILSLGANISNILSSSSTLTMNQSVSLALSVLTSGLIIVSSLDSINTQEELDRLAKETQEAEEAAEMYETNLRFMYGPAYESTIRNSMEADPYKSIKDTYSKFSTYKSEGFRDNGFVRPNNYGF